MISLKQFKGFSNNKKKTEKNRNQEMIKVIDALIKCNPEEYEILDDVKIDLVEGISLSSLKKEQLKKAINKFKETTKTKTDDKEENMELVSMSKVEDCKIFTYHIKNAVDLLVTESEVLKKDTDNLDSELIITAKNKLQTSCNIVFSEILQVQNELEKQINILKNLQTRLTIMDEQVKRSES